MAVPKKRTPSSRRDRRRANIFIKEPQLVKCKKCGKPTLPHTVCHECGFYKGKEYINVMAKLEKKQKAASVASEANESTEEVKKEKKTKVKATTKKELKTEPSKE
ncbi:MAG TPA: 50S ribosomal protein L32 [Candidatus Pacearchaeota archaeon]|nr:50S ribosomal protein L32 [Candidatus Pacearchaeota archaeon]